MGFSINPNRISCSPTEYHTLDLCLPVVTCLTYSSSLTQAPSHNTNCRNSQSTSLRMSLTVHNFTKLSPISTPSYTTCKIVSSQFETGHHDQYISSDFEWYINNTLTWHNSPRCVFASAPFTTATSSLPSLSVPRSILFVYTRLPHPPQPAMPCNEDYRVETEKK